LNNQRDDAYDQLDQIKTKQNVQYNNKVDAIQSSLNALNQQIQDRSDTVRELRQNSQELSGENVQDEIIQRLESNIDQIQSRIEEVERWLNSNEGEQIKKAQRAIGVIDDGKIGVNTRRNFDSWRASEEQRIEPLRARIQDRLSEISRENEQQKNSRNRQIAELSDEIKNLESKRANKELELQSAKIGDGDISDTRSSALMTKIDQINQEIKTLNQRHDAELEQIRSSRNAVQQDYELSKKQIETKKFRSQKVYP
jgi:chromosome segregation ATPase